MLACSEQDGEKLKVSVHGPDFWQRIWDVDTAGAPEGGPGTQPPSCAVCLKAEEVQRAQRGHGLARKGSREYLADLQILEEDEDEDELEEGVEDEAEEDEDEGAGEGLEGSLTQMEWEHTGASAAGVPRASPVATGPNTDRKAGRRGARQDQGKLQFRGMSEASGGDQSSLSKSSSATRGVQLVVKRRWAPGGPGAPQGDLSPALGSLDSGARVGAGAPHPVWSAADSLLLLSEALLLQLPSPSTRPACAPALHWPKVSQGWS